MRDSMMLARELINLINSWDPRTPEEIAKEKEEAELYAKKNQGCALVRFSFMKSLLGDDITLLWNIKQDLLRCSKSDAVANYVGFLKHLTVSRISGGDVQLSGLLKALHTRFYAHTGFDDEDLQYFKRSLIASHSTGDVTEGSTAAAAAAAVTAPRRDTL